MNPSNVFAPRRLMRADRTARFARTCRCLLAVAATLPTVFSVSAQNPGTKDTAFFPTQPLATVYALLYQTDGSANSVVLAGGDNGYLATSLQPNGVPKGNLVAPVYGSDLSRIVFTAVSERVNTSGTTIPKTLLGGFFGQSVFQIYTKTPAQNITRIFPNGTQDTSFAVGAGTNGYVTSIVPLADGRIVVGGLFTTFNQLPRLRIARLMNDGSIDLTFSTSSIIDNDVLALAEGVAPYATVTNPDGTVTPQPDGTILVGGTFNHVGGLPITKLARINADGNVDATFHPVIDSRVNAITVQPTGKIIIGGEFTSINGQPASRIARLNYDGSLDTTFAATVSGLPTGEPNPTAVYTFYQLKPTLQSNGSLAGNKIYVGGNFTQIDGLTRRYLGLINPNGTVGAFDPGVTIYDKVESVFVRPDGRVMIGETLGPKIGMIYQPTLIRLYGATPTN